jgi:hypothetical protein
LWDFKLRKGKCGRLNIRPEEARKKYKVVKKESSQLSENQRNWELKK